MVRKKIFVFSTTRAEYGLLKNLIQNNNYKNLDIKLVVTGSHLSKKFGSTINEIKKDKVTIFKTIKILSKDNNTSSSLNYIDCFNKVDKFLKLRKPDLVILLGDRFETFAIANACNFNKIKICHIQGGEITQGSMDDFYRHAITKFSHIHFTATKNAKLVVKQLGENPRYIFNTGSLLLDNFKNHKKLNKKKLEQLLKIKFFKKNLMLTLHPSSNHFEKIRLETKILSSVISELKNIMFIVTYPNQDAGHEIIIKAFTKLKKKVSNLKIYKSLGQKIYHSCLDVVDGVIGNSSSGIIEAPYFNKKVINIGDRQHGRIIGIQNVKTVKFNKRKIIKSINFILNNRVKNKKNNYIYGKSPAAPKILKILSNLNLEDIKFNKTFNTITH